MRHIKMIVFGLTYGVASPVPGLDGGTFFILFNVYDDFIKAANLTNIRKKLPVVTLFLIGCISGLFGISNLMMRLLYYHELIMYFSFSGLILGCVPMIYKKSAFNISEQGLSLKNAAIFAFALAIMLFLAFYSTEPGAYDYVYQAYETTVHLAWVLFASAVSAVGMLIPGVGGAILMLILGIYTAYIEALATLDFAVLITLAAGMALGILAGIKVVRRILLGYPGELYCAILGFTIGSVFIVFPGVAVGIEGVFAFAGMILFAGLAYWFSRKG